MRIFHNCNPHTLNIFDNDYRKTTHGIDICDEYIVLSYVYCNPKDQYSRNIGSEKIKNTNEAIKTDLKNFLKNHSIDDSSCLKITNLNQYFHEWFTKNITGFYIRNIFNKFFIDGIILSQEQFIRYFFSPIYDEYKNTPFTNRGLSKFLTIKNIEDCIKKMKSRELLNISYQCLIDVISDIEDATNKEYIVPQIPF